MSLMQDNKFDFQLDFSLDSNDADNRIKMDDATFLMLRDFIYEQCGIYLNDNKKYLLENRLAKRLRQLNMSSFLEYLNYLRNGKINQEELTHLFDAITINETSFFRNEPQIRAFQEVVFPELLKRASREKKSSLRILSAGCSTGEEPFTLAMVIYENFRHQLNGLNLDIVGIDISQEAIQIANKGEYSDFSMRNIDENHLKKYFTQENSLFKLKDQIRSMVRFKVANIINEGEMKLLGRFDVIFCRNVLIYFNKESKERAIKILYDILNPGGFLFVDHSESLYGITRAFKLVHFNRAIAYKKD